MAASPLLAQVSPPGLSTTKGAVWTALGFSQHVGEHWLLSTYVGYARQGDPDNWSALKKQGIGVVDQNVQYSFNAHWQLALCGSVRRQNEYQDESPYALEDPSFRYEVRYYSRLYYRHQFRKLNFTYSFRPELRTFYQPDWNPWPTPLELRFRLKAQVSLPLNADKTNLLIGANELLTALDEEQDHVHWTPYRFTEDRFTVYFRHLFPKPAVALDIGLMQQSRKVSDRPGLQEATYLSVDLLFQDPFHKHH